MRSIGSFSNSKQFFGERLWGVRDSDIVRRIDAKALRADGCGNHGRARGPRSVNLQSRAAADAKRNNGYGGAPRHPSEATSRRHRSGGDGQRIGQAGFATIFGDGGGDVRQGCEFYRRFRCPYQAAEGAGGRSIAAR